MAECVSCTISTLTFSSAFGNDVFERIVFGQEKNTEQDRFTNCPDCAAPIGGLHHFECDWEQCPRCKEQLLGCNCDFLPMQTVLPEEQAQWQMLLPLDLE